MSESLNRLIAAGFRPAGKWSLENEELLLTLEPNLKHEQNVLYAFAVDGALTYVGKTTQSLLKRMQGYRSPASNGDRGGTTNIKNNRNIRNALEAGSVVDIYLLHALPNQSHGGFSVNLSAGLEDSLIQALSPPWNGKAGTGKAQLSLSPERPAARQAQPFGAAVGFEEHGAIVMNRDDVPSTENLFAFCKKIQGEPLTTLTRKAKFRVEVIGAFLEFIPESSGGPRKESKVNVTALLSRFRETGSFRMADYQDVSFNASYVLALVKAWQSQNEGEK